MKPGIRLSVILLLLGGLHVAGAALADVAPVSARQASDFTALRERPLFSPDRSAPTPPPPEPEPDYVEPPPPVVETAPPASAPDWELVGLVRSNQVNRAVFRVPGSEPSFSLRLGDSRDGWTLSELKRFEVILDSDHGRASLRYSSGR